MRFCLPANFKIDEIEKYKLFESLHKGNFIELWKSYWFRTRSIIE